MNEASQQGPPASMAPSPAPSGLSRGGYWSDLVPNEEPCLRSGQLNIPCTIAPRRVCWLDHALQRPDDHSTSSNRYLQTGDDLSVDHVDAGRTSSARTTSMLEDVPTLCQNYNSWRDQVAPVDSTASWPEI